MVKASKLVNGIDFGLEKEYNLAEVFLDSEELNVDDLRDNPQSMTSLAQSPVDASLAMHQVKAGADEENILDKLYTPCIASKSTWVVRRDKNMTLTTNKLEKVYIDLWDSYNLPFQTGNSYAAILMCEHTRKTWTLYLQGKDDFVNAF